MWLPLGPGARNQGVIRRVPGLIEIARTDSYSNCRGLLLAGTALLVVFSTRVVKVEVSGGGYTVTDLGALAGTGEVFIARNNAATPNIVAVTENGAFNLSISGAPTSFADGDLPQPNSVTFLDGYFFFSIGDGRIFASGLNAVTIDATHFTTANARAGDSGARLHRVVAFGSLLYACGPHSIEVYQNTGNPTGFPFSRVAVIETGTASATAIAEHSEGWVAEFIFVGDDDVVYRLNGFTPVPVSTADVVRSIAAVEDKDDLHATTYMVAGNPIWSIKGPEFCWEYNLATGEWHERQSYQSDTWRGQCTVKAFGDWICGEADSGRLFAIRESVHREGNDPLVWRVRSVQGHAFPQRIRVPRADFDFAAGVGTASGDDPIETAPRVAVSWSDDGGATWATPLLRALGGEGVYGQRVTVHRTGLTGPKGRQWELAVSDPVHVGLLAGTQEVTARKP